MLSDLADGFDSIPIHQINQIADLTAILEGSLASTLGRLQTVTEILAERPLFTKADVRSH